LFTLQYTVIYFCIIICSLGIRRYDDNYFFPSSLRVLLFSVFFHDRWNTGPYEIYMFSNLLFSIRIPIIILYFSIAAFFYIPTFQRALSYNFFPLHIHFSFYDISNPATTCGVFTYVKNIAQDKISGKHMSKTQHGVMQRKTIDWNWKGIKSN